MVGVTPLWKMCRKNMHIKNEYVRGAMGEFLGTAILCMFAVGAGMQTFVTYGAPGGLQAIIGGTTGIMVAIIVTGGLSGAHINPAVSLGLAVAGELSWIKLPIYWFSQFLGGYVGSGFAVAMYKGIADIQKRARGPDTEYRDFINPNVFSPVPYPCSTDGAVTSGTPLAVGTGILDQIMGTSILLITLLACLDPRNMKIPKHFIGLTFALTVAGISMVFGFNAGAVMNPARDLAPRLMALTIGFRSSDVMQSIVVSDDGTPSCQEWWLVGFFGPLIGALVGAFIYILAVGAHLDDEEESSGPQQDGNGNGNQDWRQTHFIPKAQSPNPPPPPPQQPPMSPQYNQGGQGGVNNNGYMRDDMRYRQGY